MQIRRSRAAVAALVLALGVTGFATAGCSSSPKACQGNADLESSAKDLQNSAGDPAAMGQKLKDFAVKLHADANKSDGDAKTAINNLADDMDQIGSKMASAQGGDTAALSDLQTLLTKMQTDLGAAEKVCKA